MSRRKTPPLISGDTPEHALDVVPLISDNSKRRRNKIPKPRREKLLAKARYRCQGCGATEDLTVDHIVPLSKGGSSRESNLQVLCKDCNEFKGKTSDRTVAQRWRL